MDEKMSNMTALERTRGLSAPCAHPDITKPFRCQECILLAISTAEQEAHAAGRKAERERIVEWIKAEARDCGCWERILENVEAADG